MSRDEAYEMWRLGQSIERADMTTRVVGVRAAALLALPSEAEDHDEVQWMGVLRSLSAMQMFQRSHRGPIDGDSVVRFLVADPIFPRSVQRLRRPHPSGPRPPAAAQGRAGQRRRARRGDRRALGRRATTRWRSTRRWTTSRSGSPRCSAAVHSEFVVGSA